MNIFRDNEFQKILLSFIVKDRNFLKDIGRHLEPSDFKPTSKEEGREIWLLATWAIEYYRERGEPLGGLLRSWVIDKADELKLNDKATESLLDLVKDLQSISKDVISVDAVAEKVIKFKKHQMKKRAIDKIIDLEEEGKLTDEAWEDIVQEAIAWQERDYKIVDFFASDEIKKRLKRREESILLKRYPFLMIDEFDEKYRGLGRGTIGLVLAYLKMGKSLLLIWFALAYIFQGLNVLYFTLEDDLDETQDRFDAAITEMMVKTLGDHSKRFKQKLKRMRKIIKGKLKIVDGTEGGMSPTRIEEIWEKERNTGFAADAVIVDYDEYIEPPRKRSEPRFEMSDTYKACRKFAAKRDLLFWLAAQASKKAEGRKVVTSGMAAEDISKMRKCFLSISIGEGEWGDDSRYLYVPARKNDKQKVGVMVYANPDKSLAYDRLRTLKKLAKVSKQKSRKD